MGKTVPRRAAKKAATRQALADAALVLFAERGFDLVTAEEIAHEAGVSLRTFFRYFPAKESVLLFGEFQFFTALTEAYREVPPEVGEREAILLSLRASIPEIEPHRRRAQLHYEAVAQSPILRGHQQIHHDESVARFAAAIAERRGLPGADGGSELVALLAVTTLEHAIMQWAAGPTGMELADCLTARIDLLHEFLYAGR